MRSCSFRRQLPKERRTRQWLSASPGSDSDSKRSFLLDPDEAVHHSVLIEETSGDYAKRVDGKLGFKSFVLPSCCVFPCVLAISQQPIGQHAQAKEGEAEKLRLLLRYLDGSSFRSSFLCLPQGTA